MATAPEQSSSTGRAAKIAKTETSEGATVYCFGTNDCGQLGIECEKRKFPAIVTEIENKKVNHLKILGFNYFRMSITLIT